MPNTKEEGMTIKINAGAKNLDLDTLTDADKKRRLIAQHAAEAKRQFDTVVENAAADWRDLPLVCDYFDDVFCNLSRYIGEQSTRVYSLDSQKKEKALNDIEDEILEAAARSMVVGLDTVTAKTNKIGNIGLNQTIENQREIISAIDYDLLVAVIRRTFVGI